MNDTQQTYPVDYRNSSLSDQEMINREYQALVQDYLNSNHRRKVERIEKAFLFANKAHDGVRRRSGEPYIMHPLAIGRIVCREMGLGSTSIVCALLHDVVEDTDYTVEDIKALFGEKVAQIVDGLTKISAELFSSETIKSIQAENFRKLLLTMNDDIRVILIKIADRLHNMRTIDAMRSASQMKIAGETLYVYAPLAHRLGLFAIKTELEDLSFRVEHPDEYHEIKQRIDASEESRQEFFADFITPLHAPFQKRGLIYEIQARVKSCYSIWKKMQGKAIPFEEIYDIFAVRIIFESMPYVSDKELCWGLYSDITDIYRINPERTRDWVNNPKSNGYQALHLTVMGNHGKWVEIQIRSQKMDDIAERGFAAHWKYKSAHIEEDTELDKWISSIGELLKDPGPDAVDVLDALTLNLYSGEVLTFTPRGECLNLPQGATALDFAYAIHTDLGNQCLGAKVNHKLVPLSYRLQSGDQVEIITSANQNPKPEWRKYVTTAKAKSKVEEELRKERRTLVSKGEEIVLAQFQKANQEVTATQLDQIAAHFGFTTREEFFFSVGSGQTSLPENFGKLITESSGGSNFIRKLLGLTPKRNLSKIAPPPNYSVEDINFKKPYLLVDHNNERNYDIAVCCHPIPGDPVIGFVMNKRVIIHKRSCPEAIRLKSIYGDKILQPVWSEFSHGSFSTTLEIEGIDSKGILNAITQSITEDFSLDITDVNISSRDGVFRGKIQVIVHNATEIRKLIEALKQHPGINGVFRTLE